MNNQKGLTLVEVLGSIILLGVAVLGITFILQQSSIHTKSNEQLDESITISRNVMEQIKNQLKSNNETLILYEQSLSLEGLRHLASLTVYYPNSIQREYEINIQSADAALGHAQAADLNLNLDAMFRQITIHTKELSSGKTFELTAYVEYK